MSLQPHVDRHALLAFEKQMHAYDVVGDRGWDVDLDAGTIVFDDKLEMRVALLGTEDEHHWVWGWADPDEEFPESVVAAGRSLGEYGRAHALPALYEGQSELSEDVTLDRIGVIASGVLDLKATYHSPLDGGGRVLFALDHPLLELPAFDQERFDAVFAAVRESGFVHDWTAAMRGYKAARGV